MLYYYTARNAEGRFVRGSLEAVTEEMALSILRTRALFVSSLESAATALGIAASAFQWRPVSHRENVALFRSLATLVHAGVALPRALSICIEQCGDSRLREALRAAAADIETGLLLSEAMLRHPREFPKLFSTLIRAGEHTGALDEVLERLATTLERDHAVRKRVAAALTYPGIVCVTAIGVIVLLLTTVVPMFRGMYQQLHVPLPGIVVLLEDVAAVLRSPPALVGIALLVCVPALLIARRTANGRAAAIVESIRMNLPIAGSILRKATLSRLARILGMLLRSGITLHGALPIVFELASGPRFAASIQLLARSIAQGSSMAEPLQASGLYDALFLQLVRVGEETGSLDTMLLQIADYYELDVEIALQALGSSLEPLMIVILGGGVGFIVASIFIPLYTLIGNIK